MKVERITNSGYLKSLASCEGLLTGGGFEYPAEALFLGKKLFVIPMKGQYEQQCNAEALRRLGVPTVSSLEQSSVPSLEEWVQNGKAIQVNYPNQTAEINSSC